MQTCLIFDSFRPSKKTITSADWIVIERGRLFWLKPLFSVSKSAM